VNRVGAVGGVVTSSPAGINCSSSGSGCSASYNYNTFVTLTAAHLPSSYFGGWSGDCTGMQTTCSVSLTKARNVTASFTPANYVFVTSTTTAPGTFAQLGAGDPFAGADGICNQRATAVGLPGHYIALLSTSTTNFASRLNGASGWVRPDKRPVMNAFIDVNRRQKMFYVPSLNELGKPVDGTLVVTGSKYDGTVKTLTCNDWTSTNPNDTFSGGTPTDFGLTWDDTTKPMHPECPTAAPLYCFGTDYTANVTPPPPTGVRLTFTTTGNFAVKSGGSIADADAFCQSEATAHGIPGTFLALLTTSTASAASRFDLTKTPWYRLDGAQVWNVASDLGVANATLLTAPDLTSDGVGSATFSGIWTGAEDAVSVGNPDFTCHDWSSSLNSVSGGIGSSYMTLQPPFDHGWFNGGVSGCDNTFVKLYCLQQ
jgi:hypothetical protein